MVFYTTYKKSGQHITEKISGLAMQDLAYVPWLLEEWTHSDRDSLLEFLLDTPTLEKNSFDAIIIRS